jgi:transcriptional regulator with XRE-family HTH domain
MPAFASELGISRDRLASYEYARAPVRFSLATRMCDRFNINQRWLATGRLPSRHYVDVHDYTESQIPEKMLFSEAYDVYLSKPLDSQIAQLAKSLRCTEEEIENNWQRIGASWPVGSPGVKLSELYHERLLQLRLHQQPEGVQKNIYRQLGAVLDQLLPGGHFNSLPGSGAKKTDLTYPATSAKHWKVKPQLPSLLERLNQATKETGKMSALAHFLGKAIGHRVPLASVSRWLSGKREPGGQITLLMQHWVEQQERQK